MLRLRQPQVSKHLRHREIRITRASTLRPTSEGGMRESYQQLTEIVSDLRAG